MISKGAVISVPAVRYQKDRMGLFVLQVQGEGENRREAIMYRNETGTKKEMAGSSEQSVSFHCHSYIACYCQHLEMAAPMTYLSRIVCSVNWLQTADSSDGLEVQPMARLESKKLRAGSGKAEQEVVAVQQEKFVIHCFAIGRKRAL